jgi:hypothetical protein
LICLFQPTFFGLTNAYVKDVYEQIFLLKYHGGWSFTEVYNLPIALREWFVKRLSEQFEKESKQIEDARNSSNRSKY